MAIGDILFDSVDLRVRRAGAWGGVCFVTFGSYTNEGTLDREGFAEGFLHHEAIDAVHVINRDNRWYQYPEMDAALAAVRAGVAGRSRIITYGSSMGGYAALRFGRMIGADTAIAISPQYSLDPRVVPFEDRWQADVARIRFRETPHEPVARAYIFYDPRMPTDAAHVDAFARDGGDIVRVGIPYAGHPVGPILAETGVLKDAVRAIVAGDFSAQALQRQVREQRRLSQHHFFMLSRRAEHRRPKLAIAFLRRAAAIEPESHINSELAALLDREGKHDEARGFHRAALARTPGNIRAQINYARHLEATGDPIGAADVLKAALHGQAGSIRLILRVVQLRMALRRHRLGAVDRVFEVGLARVKRSPSYARVVRVLGRAMQ